MHLKIYCEKCGAPNLYIDAKPHFCSTCSASFNPGKPQKAPPKLKARQIEKEEEIEEDLDKEDNVEVPDIKKLEYKIEKFGNRGVKFEEVYAQGKGGSGGEGFKRPTVNYTMEDFKKEASNSKVRIDSEGEND